jgi:hypothetical protein
MLSGRRILYGKIKRERHKTEENYKNRMRNNGRKKEHKQRNKESRRVPSEILFLPDDVGSKHI